MGLRDDFELARSYILHQNPLPTVSQAIHKLVDDETRLQTNLCSSQTMVLATPATVPQSAPVFPSTDSSAYTSKWKGNNTRRQHNKKPLLICSFCKNKGHSIEACYTRQRILKNTAALTQSELSTMGSPALESPSQPSQEAYTTPYLSLADLQDMVNQVHIPSSSASNTALSTISGNSPTWLLDSACCNHMSSSLNVIPSHTPCSLPTIYTANGSSMHVSHQGTISTPNLSVSNVYHISQLTHNLLSVGQLTELGFSLTFSSNGVVVQDPQTGQMIRTARKVGRLFELISLHLPSSHLSAPTVSGTNPFSSLALWHSRLGHASISRVKELASMGLLGSVSIENFDYMPCQLGKQTALPFNKSVSHALSSFDLIHSDVWGPSPIPTQGGSRYFVIFVDDFSRYTWIYLFKNRSELSQIYRDFTKMIETQFSKPIKVFRSDNAQEYKAHEFTIFSINLVLSLTLLVLALLNKMVGLSANFIIFLMLFVPLLLPLLLHLRFGGKLLLLPFIPSIGVRLLLLRTKLLVVYCLVLLPPMIYFEFLDVSVLFFFTSTNETNFSLVLVYVVFLGMVLVKKDIGVTTPLANVFVFLGMWSFGNTKCFTKSLMFLNHLSPLLIKSLIFFLKKPPLLFLHSPLLLLIYLLMSLQHRSSTCPMILLQLWILPVRLTHMHFVVPIG